LLANLLAASTYPLEVVQADRWLDEHKDLKGDAVKTEVDKQGWDDSVKALAGTPSVLSMMSDKLDWIKDLGDAVLAQQPDVMDAIQQPCCRRRQKGRARDGDQERVTNVQSARGRDAARAERPRRHAELRRQGQDDRGICASRLSCGTFLVNHSGTVYQKDLGDYTMTLVSRMMWFDPDQTWKKVVVPGR
jgi:hypothetical protein